MAGTFRFGLATFVVLSHLVGAAGLEHYGFFAVRTFFVLSGFVITGALNDVYRFDARRFWTNRALRLMPIYLVVCAATLLALRLYPREGAAFLQRWAFEPTVDAVLQNFALLPLAVVDLDLRLIVPAWSVGVEVLMYMLLFLGMGRSKRGAIICLALGVAWHCTLLLVDAPFEYRYFSPSSALFSFAAGALIYFLRKEGLAPSGPLWFYASLAAWTANVVAAGVITSASYEHYLGYYVNTVLASAVVVSLPAVKPSPAGKRLDDLLGSLCYPLFLVHWLAAFLTHLFLTPELSRGWMFFLAAIPPVLILSAALALMQVKIFDPVRDAIRSQGTAKIEPEETPVALRSA